MTTITTDRLYLVGDRVLVIDGVYAPIVARVVEVLNDCVRVAKGDGTTFAVVRSQICTLPEAADAVRLGRRTHRV